ncbi:MAG: hypothetical protein BWY79_00817 [Actinobacteria bacterium ADurb.Bin444]|nr:MAG: hypothetical protein BWY79_00817 [Actinobacteria bacterium ADurb.Bin444]
MLQCHDPGRRYHARLSHATSQHLADLPGARDESRRAGHDGAHRGPEAFGEADLHTVRVAGYLRGRHSKIRGRVEEPGTIEVDGETVTVTEGTGGRHIVETEHSTAHAIVRVLQTDQARFGIVGVGRSDPFLHPHKIQAAVRLVGQRSVGDAAQSGRAGHLRPVDVRPLTEYDLVSPPAMSENAHQVAHGATGHEQTRLFPQHLRA